MPWTGFKFSDEKPEDFDPTDPYADPVALLKYREYATRRKQIDVEKAKLLRRKVEECYYTEGVDHLQNCREYVLNYIESIKDIGIHVNNAGLFDSNKAQREAKIREEYGK